MTLFWTEGRSVPEGFVDLPSEIYADDERYIPEDSAAIARAFSASNPWFRQGQARVYCAPGKCRAAAFVSTAQVVDGRASGYFGYFESVGDAHAEREMFVALERWLRSEGAEVVYGPINFTTFGAYRILLKEHELPLGAVMAEPHNPLTYAEWLGRNGYRLRSRYLSQFFGKAKSEQIRDGHRARRERLEAEGFSFDVMLPETWVDSLPEIHRFVDQVFGANFGYTPLSYEAFASALGISFISRTDPEGSVLVRSPDKQIAAFALALPNYGPLLSQAAGERRMSMQDVSAANIPDLQAFAAEHGLLLTVAGKTLAVAPEFRQLGLMSAMAGTVVERTIRRYDVWIAATMRADSYSTRAGAGLAPDGESEFGLFEKLLDD